jgi:peroxiredoxin
MAVSSTMLDLGTPAPDFSLPDVTTGQPVSLRDFADKQALLVIFLCAHCPYVVHVQPELVRLAKDYGSRGVGIVGITSNDPIQYPQDAPEPTAAAVRAAGLSFPVLFDETQSVAKAYTAACTPDFFLFGPDRRLVYRGQLDDSRPGRGPDRPGPGNRLPPSNSRASAATSSGSPGTSRRISRFRPDSSIPDKDHSHAEHRRTRRAFWKFLNARFLWIPQPDGAVPTLQGVSRPSAALLLWRREMAHEEPGKIGER